MRYAKIDEYEVINGEGNGISIFVQGCRFRCCDCFNPETHDFNGGEEWTEDIKKKFFELADRPYIKRISILGGEPLEKENLNEVSELVEEVRNYFKNNKKIWLYTGFCWKEIFEAYSISQRQRQVSEVRKKIISLCDVLVDGRFVKELADTSYPFAGSTNQRVIDVQKSLSEKKICLWENK